MAKILLQIMFLALLVRRVRACVLPIGMLVLVKVRLFAESRERVWGVVSLSLLSSIHINKLLCRLGAGYRNNEQLNCLLLSCGVTGLV